MKIQRRWLTKTMGVMTKIVKIITITMKSEKIQITSFNNQILNSLKLFVKAFVEVIHWSIQGFKSSFETDKMSDSYQFGGRPIPDEPRTDGRCRAAARKLRSNGSFVRAMRGGEDVSTRASYVSDWIERFHLVSHRYRLVRTDPIADRHIR